MLFVVSYIFGMIFAALGFYLFLKTKDRDKRASLVLVFFVFIAIVIWYIPLEISQEVYSAPEGVLSAILQGVASLTGDSYSKEMVANPRISALFSFSIMLARIVILVFLFDIVISFVVVPYQYILNWHGRNKPTFVFCGLNDKTLNIAKSIADGKKYRLIFACTEGPGPDKLERLRNVGGIYFAKDISYIFKHLIADRPMECIEVFVFGENDTDNIECLAEIADVTKNDSTRYIRTYVELENTSRIIQDSISNSYRHIERLIVSFVRTSEDFAYNNLYDNLIIDNTIIENDTRVINALMIGSGSITMGMVRCMLWLCQLPGYRIEIEIISDDKFISRFRYTCPEIKGEIDKPGMAVYQLRMYEGIRYRSEEFASLIKDNAGFTFAFVNSGDDMMNYNIAADLYMYRKRAGIGDDCSIQVRNDVVSGIFDRYDDLWKYVKVVGTVEDLYSYSYLTNAPIENAANLIHDKRQQTKELSKRVAWLDYCRDEYKRRSTFARALSLRYRLYIISQDYHAKYSLLETDETWMMYEHMRWNVYMQTSGYIKSDTKDIDVGKTHPDIKPFEELEKIIQVQDAVSVDDDIVNSLLKKRWSKGRFVSKECNRFRIADVGEFVEFFSESHDELIGAKHRFVDSHTEKELYGTTRIIFVDENDVPEAYVAVNCKDGNIGSVMKDKDSSKKGFIADMLYTATEYNGSKLDCYDDARSTLPRCYSMAGFMPVCRIRFDETQVSADWTPEAGKPDIVFMFFTDPGIEYDRYRQKVMNGEYITYEKYTYVPYVDEFSQWAKSKSFSDDYSFGWFIRDYVQKCWEEKHGNYLGRENVFVKEMIGNRK